MNFSLNLIFCEKFYNNFCLFIFRLLVLKMVTSLTETSNETNKSFFTNVCVLLFISNLYLKKFKQFCLGELLTKWLFF